MPAGLSVPKNPVAAWRAVPVLAVPDIRVPFIAVPDIRVPFIGLW